MEILKCRYKDPYKSISITECHKGFDRCSDGLVQPPSFPSANLKDHGSRLSIDNGSLAGETLGFIQKTFRRFGFDPFKTGKSG